MSEDIATELDFIGGRLSALEDHFMNFICIFAEINGFDLSYSKSNYKLTKKEGIR